MPVAASSMRRWVSLGGWCGPGLMLAKLGIRPPGEQLPFDAVRCSLDGLVHFVSHGFENDFFPAGPPYAYDPASIWLLFRGTHTCITHFDINNPHIRKTFDQSFQRWSDMVERPSRPVTFLRTSIAENPYTEAALLPMLEDALDKKSNKKLDFRTVLIVHDQGSTTSQVAMPTPRSVVWNLALDHSLGSDASLLDRTERGYRTIVEATKDDVLWQRSSGPITTPCPTESPKLYTTLCTVEGVPAFKGSCKGIGTTAMAAVGRCVFCGCSQGHPVDPRHFDSGREWSSDDDTELLLTFASVGDVVATCEHVAGKQKRSANECLGRLQHLKEQDDPRPI